VPVEDFSELGRWSKLQMKDFNPAPPDSGVEMYTNLGTIRRKPRLCASEDFIEIVRTNLK